MKISSKSIGKYNCNLRTVYTNYHEQYGRGVFPGGKNGFLKHITAINDLLLKKLIVDDRKIIRFPHIGKILVVKTKSQMVNKKGEIILRINWHKTKQLWKEDPEAHAKYKKVYMTNEHTDGYKFRFKWSKQGKVKNQTAYMFRPSESVRQHLNKVLFDPNRSKQYIEIKKRKPCISTEKNSGTTQSAQKAVV